MGFKEQQEPGRCQRISLCFFGLARGQASFDLGQGSPELELYLASGKSAMATWTTWSQEMTYKQSGLMMSSRRNKLKRWRREKCSAPTDTDMSSSDSGFTCWPIVEIWKVYPNTAARQNLPENTDSYIIVTFMNNSMVYEC